MLFAAFFSWWYGNGWKQAAGDFGPRLAGVSNLFSVRQLVQTLFAPWRRIITYPGASLAERWRAWGDNLFSRCVGFVVRLLVLFTAFCTLLVVALGIGLEIIIWPLLPLAVPVLIVVGFVV